MGKLWNRVDRIPIGYLVAAYAGVLLLLTGVIAIASLGGGRK